VLRHSKSGPVLEEMARQEQVHLDYFSQILPQRRVRPTLFHPLWHVGAYLLGAGTALLGEKAAMACTVAVESGTDISPASRSRRPPWPSLSPPHLARRSAHAL
jgi:ubiquinone biosynthesis monooxygenase Coq7